jgi:hypothetical protein
MQYFYLLSNTTEPFCANFSVRTLLSLNYFPKMVFLYFFAFHLYLFSFPQGFSYLALYGTYCAIFHLMLWFFNHSEIGAYESGEISALHPRYDWGGSHVLSPDSESNLLPSTAGSISPGADNAAAAEASPVTFAHQTDSGISALRENSDQPETQTPTQNPSPPVGATTMTRSALRVAAATQSMSADCPEIDRNLTLGQVEYFSTDAASSEEASGGALSLSAGGRRSRSLPYNPRSFSTPLDEIIAFEQAIYIHQKYSKGRRGGVGHLRSSGGSFVSLESLDGSSAAGDLEEVCRQDRLTSDETCSDAGLSDYGNFVYGGAGEESGLPEGSMEGLHATALKRAELELSRQIQRQQMVAEMGFDLPHIASLTSSNAAMPAPDNRIVDAAIAPEGKAVAVHEEERRGSRRTRNSVAMFFSHLFTSKRTVERADASSLQLTPPDSAATPLSHVSSQSTSIAAPIVNTCAEQSAPLSPVSSPPRPVGSPSSSSSELDGLSRARSPPTSFQGSARGRAKSGESSTSASSASSRASGSGKGKGESVLENTSVGNGGRPEFGLPNELTGPSGHPVAQANPPHSSECVDICKANSYESISSVSRNSSSSEVYLKPPAPAPRNRPRSYSNSSFGETGYPKPACSNRPRARSEAGASSRDSSEDASLSSGRSVMTPSEADYLDEDRRGRGFSIFGMNLDEEDETEEDMAQGGEM